MSVGRHREFIANEGRAYVNDGLVILRPRGNVAENLPGLLNPGRDVFFFDEMGKTPDAMREAVR